ncbi:hypothetical protein HanOQP8_Chr01g0020651 [Helianthus annuus]|nr:hypothetical protein HanOQP8_Chr01g0020651 [Helianthus annuus]
MIDLGDDLEVEDIEIPIDGKKGELRLVVSKDTKALGKKVGGSNSSGKAIESSSNVDSGEIYVPDWKVTVSDSFKSPSVYEDVLNHFAPPVAEELKASLVQLAKDNKWLIEYGFQQVVTYLLHLSEFNSALGDVYSKLLIHGRHQGYTVGYDAGAAGSPEDKSPLFQPGAFEVFKNTVVKMERLTYPYVGEVSECYGKPLSVLQGLKPRGLNEVVCNEVLKSISKKRPHSGDSEDTCSEGGDGLKDSSLEASEVAATVRKESQEGSG